MKFERFEDIIAWKKARELTLLIYALFGTNKDYGFKDQIFRASVSIMNNIAEGYERRGNKEFKQFLYIAKGSSGEVRSMLYLAKDFKYITMGEYNTTHSLSLEISKILSGLIKAL
jgi:four helix bundle protein